MLLLLLLLLLVAGAAGAVVRYDLPAYTIDGTTPATPLLSMCTSTKKNPTVDERKNKARLNLRNYESPTPLSTLALHRSLSFPVRSDEHLHEARKLFGACNFNIHLLTKENTAACMLHIVHRYL